MLIIFLTIFVNLIGFGMIIPILPFYGERLQASELTIGLLFATYSLCQLVAAPVLGDLSDRWGRRPVLLFSLAGTGVSFIMLALADTVLLLFLARVVDGLSGGSIATARAYIVDITTEENRAKGFGLIGAAFGLGFIFGPALAGILGRFGHATPAWVAAAITFAAMALAWLRLPETVHRESARRGAAWREVPALLGQTDVGRLLLVDFVYWSCFAVYQTTFALYGARRFGFDVSQIGATLAALGVVGVVVHLRLVGPVVARLGEHLTLATGLAFGAIGLGVVAFAHSVALLVVALFPAALGIGLAGPALSSLLSRAADATEQGRLQGVAGSVESLGRIAGPIWGNGFLGAFGEGPALGSAAIVMLALAALAATLRRPRVRV